MVTKVKDWIVNFGATMDICVNKSVFTSYNIVKESKEQIFMDNSRPSPMIAKGKFSLNQS